LADTNSPFESAAQSTEAMPVQSDRAIWRAGSPDKEKRWIWFSRESTTAAAIASLRIKNGKRILREFLLAQYADIGWSTGALDIFDARSLNHNPRRTATQWLRKAVNVRGRVAAKRKARTTARKNKIQFHRRGETFILIELEGVFLAGLLGGDQPVSAHHVRDETLFLLRRQVASPFYKRHLAEGLE